MRRLQDMMCHLMRTIKVWHCLSLLLTYPCCCMFVLSLLHSRIAEYKLQGSLNSPCNTHCCNMAFLNSRHNNCCLWSCTFYITEHCFCGGDSTCCCRSASIWPMVQLWQSILCAMCCNSDTVTSVHVTRGNMHVDSICAGLLQSN